jgi:hypothetical protein
MHHGFQIGMESFWSFRIYGRDAATRPDKRALIPAFGFGAGHSSGKAPKFGLVHLLDGEFMPVLCKVGNRRDVKGIAARIVVKAAG